MTKAREGWSTWTTVTLTLLEDLKAVFLVWSPPCLKPNRCNLQTLRGAPTSWALWQYLISERSSFAFFYFLYICIWSRVPHFEFKQANCERAPPHRDNYIMHVLYLSSISVQFEHVHAAYVPVRRYMHMHANPLIGRAPTIIDWVLFFVFYSGTVELIIFTVRPACTRLEWLSDDTA